MQGYELPEIVREDYLAPYVGQRIVDQMAYVRAFPVELPLLRALLPGIETPVQIIAGRRDYMVPVVNAEYLHEHLPDSTLDILDVGHHVREEGADDYARIVTGWWRAN